VPIIVGPTVTPGQQVVNEPPGTQLANIVATLGDTSLGVVDDDGTEVFLTALTGWWSGTGSTGEVTQRSADHGGWSNMPYRTPRHIEIDVEVNAADYDAATSAIERVIDAIPLRSDTLIVASGAEALQATVQQDGDPVLSRAEDQGGKRPGWAKITIPLMAPDPRRYSVDTLTTQTGLPQTTGGMSLPLSLPLSVGATLSSGVLRVTNEGNLDTPPTLVVQGPCPPFTLSGRRVDTDGTPHPTGTLRFADAIAAGRSLIIDTANRRALMDGTATRTVTGTWFTFAPGDNEVSFSAATYDAGALLTSTHRSAWK
jgi:hypothetical protein